MQHLSTVVETKLNNHVLELATELHRCLLFNSGVMHGRIGLPAPVVTPCLAVLIDCHGKFRSLVIVKSVSGRRRSASRCSGSVASIWCSQVESVTVSVAVVHRTLYNARVVLQ